jgi:hypothetical protein
MENIQWSGGNWFGFMTANGISFGSDLLTKKAQIFSHLLIQKVIPWLILVTRIQYHIVPWFYRPIWRISHGLDATGLVS